MAPSVKVQLTPSSALKPSVMAWARRLQGLKHGWGGREPGEWGHPGTADGSVRCQNHTSEASSLQAVLISLLLSRP